MLGLLTFMFLFLPGIFLIFAGPMLSPYANVSPFLVTSVSISFGLIMTLGGGITSFKRKKKIIDPEKKEVIENWSLLFFHHNKVHSLDLFSSITLKRVVVSFHLSSQSHRNYDIFLTGRSLSIALKEVFDYKEAKTEAEKIAEHVGLPLKDQDPIIDMSS